MATLRFDVAAGEWHGNEENGMGMRRMAWEQGKAKEIYATMRRVKLAMPMLKCAIPTT